MTARRFFGAALLAGLVAVSAADADEPTTRVFHIGIVAGSPRSDPAHVAFEGRLRELGYVEGRNLTIDFVRDNDLDRLAAAVGEFARRGVDVIKVDGRDAELRAAVSAASPTPIMFTAVESDPLAKGYVASLAHPGGNLTGVTFQQPELIAKRLDLLMQTAPRITRIVVLYDALGVDEREAAIQAASALGIPLEAINLHTRPMITSMPWPRPTGRAVTR
jgi:putative ABC transport system substrate-binding protein